MDDDLAGAVQLAEALRQLRQRDNGTAGDATNLDLLWVAHVEDKHVLAPIESLLQFLYGDVAARRDGRRCFLAAHAAELFVVDQFRDGWMVAADGALRIA